MTGRCNAKCVHCDIWQNRGPETTLTVDQWGRVLTDLRQWLGPVQIVFTGGEALMKSFTVELVRFAVDIGLIVEVLTNGYWKDQTRIERLARTNPWRITVSLDGVGDTHSLIRGRSDFFERTEQSLRTLNNLRRSERLGFKLRLKTVVMKQNLEAVCDVAHYAASSGFEVFYQPIEQNYNQAEDASWFEHSETWRVETRALSRAHYRSPRGTTSLRSIGDWLRERLKHSFLGIHGNIRTQIVNLRFGFTKCFAQTERLIARMKWS